ncbi:CocE/NonD family hydrolase [Paroceanicella profunda]|uniref:CocE/NonD family hydrolase n=1 Tax=Paroceanicella profunda TaxID=2579971 RepID=A0A5B8FYL7_9RHOB|nr:CocE/NonD family hydrolase [Paroceanicella profunda]QDL91759.1 CocE/NonD family hydrolase [Paroceanicella profunda]
MKTVTQFPHEVVETPDMAIVMPDGCRLSARVWMPADAAARPVPAIVEHLPYRKRDGTTARDCLTHPWLAGHGYACIRIDMRGNGDSEGLMEDEYTAQELQDACDAIAWIAAQPWCSGKVGMMGISWGGFNALQVAALRPPALKAIVTMCSTDDRFNDDVHYKGGLPLAELLGWGATMLSFTPRPPDPALRPDWRELWMQRTETNPMLHAIWAAHQTRDAYWKHGSVCEDYDAIEAAVLAVGGWGDAYKNTVSRLVSNLKAPAKGIIGPWIHKYPHFAKPEPIGFLQEMKRWWDHWLKGEDTGVEADPDMRLYLMDSVRPQTWYDTRPGRWIAEAEWPAPGLLEAVLHMGPGGSLAERPAPFSALVRSPADCGLHGGEYCAIYWGPELPDDQRRDDALSACFDSPALSEPMDIVGGPEVVLRLKADRPKAQVCVRLNDVHPDGASTRITWGVLNLTMRDSQEAPELLEPGREYEIRLKLDDIAWRVPAGHRLRVAVSSAYWPMVWPAPEQATLTLLEGRVRLPKRKLAEGAEWSFEAPEAAAPWAVDTLRPASNSRRIETDQKTGTVTLHLRDDFGAVRDADHGLENGSWVAETWSIHPDDPLSARGEAVWEQTHGRGDWQLRTVARTAITSDADAFRITGEVVATEGDTEVFRRSYDERIPRDWS